MSAKDLPDHTTRDEGWGPSSGRDGSEPAHGDREHLLRCDLCGGPVLDRHCKRICLNCGYQRDCSDP